MRKKRLFGVMLIISALIIMTLPVSEVDAAASASDFVIEGNTLIEYQGTETDVSIPNGVETISQSAFEGNTKIRRVVIPNSVKRIEAYSFWGCDGLENVVLGTGLNEVGDFAFAGCKGLRQMYIPSNIRSIGHQAFGDCVNLKDITIPPETKDIKESSFDGCANLEIHSTEGSVADTYAKWFYEKQKENPEYEDVPNYGQDSTTEVEPQPTPTERPAPLPTSKPGEEESGNLLGSSKIVGNSAMVFVDTGSMQVITQEEKPDQDIALITPEDLGILSANGKSVPKYTVIDGKVVADQAYYKNTTLKNLQIPDGIREIGQFAFARSSLNEAVIPEGVTTIGYGAFYHCDHLTQVTLPESMMNVEPKAFEHTAWVEDFLQSEEEFLISGNTLIAYQGKGGIVTVPEGVKVIAAGAFSGQKDISKVRFPDSLRVIGEGAFEECEGITGIELGNGVEHIKDRAFAGCGRLQTVSLPKSVKTLGIDAFPVSKLTYEGTKPEETYELSATRLTNEAYRGVENDTSNPGIQVTGVDQAAAALEGAVRNYHLNLSENKTGTQIENAWQRALKQSVPGNMSFYQMALTDGSGIPITKLGHSRLRVVIPLPEELKDLKLQLVTVDRNGQLDVLPVEKVKYEGMDAVCFETTFVSEYGLFGTGKEDATEEVKELTVDMLRLSAPSMYDKEGSEKRNLNVAAKLFGLALLITGGLLLLNSIPQKQNKD